VSEQPVIAHSDAQTPRNPPKEASHEERFPGKEEEGGHSPGMKQGHENCGNPVDLVVSGGFAIKSFEFHFGWSPFFGRWITLTG
jgi:hypothetical protein